MEFVVTKIQENQANLYKAYLQLDKIKNIIQESGLFHNDSYPTPDQVVAYNITYQPELSDEGIDANKTNGSITNNIVEQTNIFFRFGDTAYINLITQVSDLNNEHNPLIQKESPCFYYHAASDFSSGFCKKLGNLLIKQSKKS